MMTPMAQQSTGRPYRCRPTTSGAARDRTATIPRGPRPPGLLDLGWWGVGGTHWKHSRSAPRVMGNGRCSSR